MLDIRELTKGYSVKRSKVLAVDKLSLKIEPGTVFGFLGPNGAGKTTTIRMLATLLKPTSGTATLFGHDLIKDAKAVKMITGYVPDSPAVYRDMTVKDYLLFTGRCYSLQEDMLTETIKRLVQRLGMAGMEDKKIATLSFGNVRKVSIAAALVHEPQFIIMDEPTSGLDPEVKVQILSFIKSLSEGGRIVFMSTHLLSEVEKIADKIGIIESGKLLAAGWKSEIISSVRKNASERAASAKVQVPEGFEFDSEFKSLIKSLPGVEKVRIRLCNDYSGSEDEKFKKAYFIDIKGGLTDETPYALIDLFRKHNFRLLSYEPLNDNLEDIYLDIIKKKRSKDSEKGI